MSEINLKVTPFPFLGIVAVSLSCVISEITCDLLRNRVCLTRVTVIRVKYESRIGYSRITFHRYATNFDSLY